MDLGRLIMAAWADEASPGVRTWAQPAWPPVPPHSRPRVTPHPVPAVGPQECPLRANPGVLGFNLFRATDACSSLLSHVLSHGLPYGAAGGGHNFTAICSLALPTSHTHKHTPPVSSSLETLLRECALLHKYLSSAYSRPRQGLGPLQ